jgi:hypothetical protein
MINGINIIVHMYISIYAWRFIRTDISIHMYIYRYQVLICVIDGGVEDT